MYIIKFAGTSRKLENSLPRNWPNILEVYE